MIYDEFPHEITFQEESRVSDGGGGWTVDYADFLTIRAHVQPITGTQRYQAQQTQTPIDYKVFYPFYDGVKPSMRILHDGNVLEVKSKPLDQGGVGEVLMVECVLNG